MVITPPRSHFPHLTDVHLSPDVAQLIGTTAIWPWNNVSNPKNGKHESAIHAADAVRNAPFLAQNERISLPFRRTPKVASLSVNTFRDFIGFTKCE